MFNLKFNDEAYPYDIYHLVKAFFPGEEIVQDVDSSFDNLILVERDGDKIFSLKMEDISYIDEKREKKLEAARRLYKKLEIISKRKLAWGILMGIRPTKLFYSQLEKGKSDEEILDWAYKKYLISEEKARFGLFIAKKEKEILKEVDYKDGYSLYVGIPFCPSICVYCSFSSTPIGGNRSLVRPYLEALKKEIRVVGEKMKGKKLNTIYVGGGTPTAIEASELDEVLTEIEKSFSFDDLLEYTVEAGRPDSITREKLMVIKKHKVTRISINPQSMNDETLKKVHRAHSSDDIFKIFDLARSIGFDNINMDLICGLPGENALDVQSTLEKIKKINPDNLTIHSLAIKRASKLRDMKEYNNKGEEAKEKALELEEMIESAYRAAKEMDMLPYYMYRQKNIAGNFENAGFSKVDKAGIYNILIMEEKQSIVALGAGATTKAVRPDLDKDRPIKRSENVKDVKTYIERIDEMIEKKGELLWR